MNTFWKRRSLIIIGSALFFCSPVALINYIVDPLWCFQHDVPIGRYQVAFDERQQKTDYLAFRKTNIDTVIFGNSRVTYMDVSAVPGKAFNYAVSSMKPYEFLPYLQFAASQSTSPIKTVIFGLSFVDTNAAFDISFDPPEKYIERATLCGFRYKSLLNLKLMYHSIDSIRREQRGNYHDAYIWEGVKIPTKRMMLPIPFETRQQEINENLAIYRNRVYGKDYVYLDNRRVYMELKKAFPTARFLVFTTPVSAHLLRLLVEQGLFDHYVRWISDAVEIFGELWNFMYFNEVTTDDNNYIDAHHYSPMVCNKIMRKLYGLTGENESEDFGIKVTSEDLALHLKFFQKNMFVK